MLFLLASVELSSGFWYGDADPDGCKIASAQRRKYLIEIEIGIEIENSSDLTANKLHFLPSVILCHLVPSAGNSSAKSDYLSRSKNFIPPELLYYLDRRQGAMRSTGRDTILFRFVQAGAGGRV